MSRHAVSLPFSPAFAIVLAVVVAALASAFYTLPVAPVATLDAAMPVEELLIKLGAPTPAHYIANPTKEDIERGRDLVFDNRTKNPPKGERSSYISKFYRCTSCHNTQREDPVLTAADPEARLDYAIQHRLPFVQGSPFYGIVNRETWYNDDYVKKYGDLARKAHNSLDESIELCAVACSQGRHLKDWELTAFKAYFQTLGVKVGDLALTPAQNTTIAAALSPSKTTANTATARTEAVALLRTKYELASPAHFFTRPADKKDGYGKKGNTARGKAVFDLACQHCHRPNGESMVILDDTKLVYEQLRRNLTKDNAYCLYEIIPYGTHSHEGHRPYMPMYPRERMSEQQVEDLRAYIVERAGQ